MSYELLDEVLESALKVLPSDKGEIVKRVSAEAKLAGLLELHGRYSPYKEIGELYSPKHHPELNAVYLIYYMQFYVAPDFQKNRARILQDYLIDYAKRDIL